MHKAVYLLLPLSAGTHQITTLPPASVRLPVMPVFSSEDTSHFPAALQSDDSVHLTFLMQKVLRQSFSNDN